MFGCYTVGKTWTTSVGAKCFHMSDVTTATTKVWMVERSWLRHMSFVLSALEALNKLPQWHCSVHPHSSVWELTGVQDSGRAINVYVQMLQSGCFMYCVHQYVVCVQYVWLWKDTLSQTIKTVTTQEAFWTRRTQVQLLLTWLALLQILRFRKIILRSSTSSILILVINAHQWWQLTT